MYGKLSGTNFTFSTVDLWRDVKVSPWIIYSKVMLSAEKNQTVAAEVAPLMKQGVIQVTKCERFAFEDYKKALEIAEKVGGSKKIMLVSS